MNQRRIIRLVETEAGTTNAFRHYGRPHVFHNPSPASINRLFQLHQRTPLGAGFVITEDHYQNVHGIPCHAYWLHFPPKGLLT